MSNNSKNDLSNINSKKGDWRFLMLLSPVSVWKNTSKARAKFNPKKWELPVEKNGNKFEKITGKKAMNKKVILEI